MVQETVSLTFQVEWQWMDQEMSISLTAITIVFRSLIPAAPLLPSGDQMAQEAVNLLTHPMWQRMDQGMSMLWKKITIVYRSLPPAIAAHIYSNVSGDQTVQETVCLATQME